MPPYVEKVIHITIYNEFGWFHLKMHYTATTFHYHCSHNRNHNGVNSFLNYYFFSSRYYETLTKRKRLVSTMFLIACKLKKKIAVSEIVLSHCRSSSAVHIEPMTSQQQPVSIA